MIKTILFYVLFFSFALSLAPAAFSFVEQERGEVAAHKRCENCHLPENDDGPADPSYDRGQWASAPSLRKGFPGVEEIGSSRLCLSCHDGSLGGDTGNHMGTDRESGIDLSRSHPVSVEYVTGFLSAGRKLNPPACITPLKLYNGKVECATCHDIHNSSHLRISKRDLCFRCHSI